MMMTEDCSRFDAGQARLLSPGGHLCLSNTIRILETQTPEYLAGAGTHTFASDRPRLVRRHRLHAGTCPAGFLFQNKRRLSAEASGINP
jgi:hypothetical protein